MNTMPNVSVEPVAAGVRVPASHLDRWPSGHPMRVFKLLGSVLCLTPLLAAGQPSESPQDTTLFLDSIVLSKRGLLCAARIPGFAEAFEPAFAEWRAERASRLKTGESLLREAAANEKFDFTLHVAAVTDPPARQLGKASQRVLETNCKAMLRKVAGLQ